MVTSTPGKLLVAARFLIGGGAFAAPVLSLRLGGIDPRPRPQSAYVLQLVGVRDALLGIGVLASSGEARRLWWSVGIACDLADAASAMAELAAGRVPRNGRSAAVLLASPFLGAALGAAALAAGDD